MRYCLLLFAAATFVFAAERPFYMGCQPWPFEVTVSGMNWVWDTIQTYGDIVNMHMEEGVPWPESYDDQP
jgi:hypothetical protein